MIRTLSAFIGLVAITVAAGAQVTNDPVYRARIATMLAGRETAIDPAETVPGRRRALPVATRSQRSIAPAALDAATAYAAANNSTAFIVWQGGRIQTESYFGDRDATSLLQSKSMSKPLTAIAVGRAIALGKIASLDQPVSDFITEWQGTPKAAILVRHLLDMRSGLLVQGFVADPESHWNRALFDPDHGRYLIHDYPMTDRPGSVYAYSNATSELVAILIERATGRRYAEFVGNEILKPIGSPSAQIWIDRPGGLAHSGCCMIAPAEQWLRLGILMLNDGVAYGRRLLPRGYVQAMTTPTEQNIHYGLGTWVPGTYVNRRGFTNSAVGPQVLHSEPFLDRSMFLFDGNHNQVMYISPATQMVVLRLGSAPPRAPEWDNSALPNMLIRGLVRRRNLSPQPLPQNVQ